MTDSNNNIISPNFEYKFIEKSLNFKLKPNLIKLLLNEIISLPTLSECYTRQLAEWTLNYYDNLVQMKFKSNEKTEINIPKNLRSQLSDTKEIMKQRAEKRRAKLLNKFNQLQTEFVNNNQDLENSIRKSTSLNEPAMISCSLTNRPMCSIGPNENMDSFVENLQKKSYHCILCQEDELTVTNETSPMVLLCYVQNSRVLSLRRGNKTSSIDDFLFKKRNELNGPYTNTCGHSMHVECWTKYSANANVRATLLNREELNENWCPLCESLCNCVLTIFPSQMNSVCAENPDDIEKTFEEWFNQLRNKTRDNLGKFQFYYFG